MNVFIVTVNEIEFTMRFCSSFSEVLLKLYMWFYIKQNSVHILMLVNDVFPENIST